MRYQVWKILAAIHLSSQVQVDPWHMVIGLGARFLSRLGDIGDLSNTARLEIDGRLFSGHPVLYCSREKQQINAASNGAAIGKGQCGRDPILQKTQRESGVRLRLSPASVTRRK